MDKYGPAHRWFASCEMDSQAKDQTAAQKTNKQITQNILILLLSNYLQDESKG